jgi:hypothetical protein
MGGVEEVTRPVAAGATTTLVIRGMVVMGGIEIRNDEAGRRRVRMGVMYPGDTYRVTRGTEEGSRGGRTEDRKD